MGPLHLGGSYERGKFPVTWEVPPVARRSAGIWGTSEPEEEYSNQFAAAGTLRDMHRWSVQLPYASQPACLLVRTGAGFEGHPHFGAVVLPLPSWAPGGVMSCFYSQRVLWGHA